MWSIIKGIGKWIFIIGLGVLTLIATLWLIALLVWPGNLWGQPVWYAAGDLLSDMFDARPVFGQRSDNDAAEAAAIIAAAASDDANTIIIAPAARTPAPTAQSEEVQTLPAIDAGTTTNGALDGKIEIGTEGPVNPGKACSGDMAYSTNGGQTWHRPFEDEPDPDNWGQILVFYEGGRIYADNAGSCFALEQVPAVAARMMTNGCDQNRGCIDVNIVPIGSRP